MDDADAGGTRREVLEAGSEPSESNDPPSDALEVTKGPELFFALVYPVGTDADLVLDVLSGALGEVEYQPQLIHMIDLLSPAQPSQDVYERYTARMDAGNELRERCERPEAFAFYWASQVTRFRAESLPGKPVDERTLNRRAYIIRSLKRPEEIRALRLIYGDALIVVAAHAPRQARSDSLTWAIARSGRKALSAESYRHQAEHLISRDENEAEDRFGQRLSDAFPMADVFVDASHPDKLRRSVNRFVETVFGHPFHTPTRMEYGMFHAQGAALRSADLSRQVGAAIASQDGEIVALGMNDVPKAGGGQYWEDDYESDRRDFTYGYDVGRDMKRRALRQVLEQLGQSRILNEKSDSLLDEAWELVEGTDLVNVTEFGRGVHAEMAAIVDAARRGVSLAGCSLYTTTFPCHVCARHIVNAGIKQVVYNEPYPKSQARFLHLDSISIDETKPYPGRTSFVPFVGLSPRLYVRLFEMERGTRRDSRTGAVAKWNKQTAEPRLSGIPANYIPKEVGALVQFTEWMA